MRKPELNGDIRTEIDATLARARQASINGDAKGSLNLVLEAWDLIPEPKEDWDYYPQSLSRVLYKRYLTLRDKDNVQKWIEIAATMYGDPNHEDQMILMMEGAAMYELGDFDRAYYAFARILEIYGSKGFAGEEKRHLRWYREEQARRR